MPLGKRKLLSLAISFSPLAITAAYMWIVFAADLPRVPPFVAALLVGLTGIWLWPTSVSKRVLLSLIYLPVMIGVLFVWMAVIGCAVFGLCL